jgi:hypothetical protein
MPSWPTSIGEPQAYSMATKANQSNAQITYNYFINKGYSPAAAAGIVGNLQAESGINPTRKQINGNAMGIAQWEPPRWNNLVRVLEGRGLDPMSLEAQLWYIDHELKSMDKRGAIDLKKFKSLQDGTEATRVFMKEYERPGIERFGERLAFASKIGSPQKVIFEDYRPAGTPLSNTGDNVSQENLLPKGGNLTPEEEAGFDRIQEKVTKGAGVTGLNKKEQEILRKRYGFAWSIFANDTTGSLFRLLGRAIKQDYTADMFIAELEGTRWAKEKDQNQEAYYLFENRYKKNNGEFLPEYTNTFERIKDKVKQEVLRQTGQLINPSDYEPEIKLWWQNNFDRVNNPAELSNFVKGIFVKKFEDLVELGGTAGDDQDKIRSYGYEMGIPLSDNQTAAYARQIALGEATIDTIQDSIRAQALRLFPGLKNALTAGVTVREVADVYVNQAARVLELNPESLNITDTKGPGRFIFQALNYVDGTGNPSQMSLTEFNKLLRGSEDWQYTENARDTYLDFGYRLAAKLGY